jgi:hypothetical protein
VRGWFPALVVPLLAIAGTWAAIALLEELWHFDLSLGTFGFFYMDLALVLSPAIAGFFVHNLASSSAHLLVSLVGPIAYAATWAFWLHSAAECNRPCLSLTFTGIEYAEGLAPYLGTLIGFGCSALRSSVSGRPSNNRSRVP